MEENIKEYQEKLSFAMDRLENYRVLNDYQEKVIAEKEPDRIFSRLTGLVEHFLKPFCVGIFTVGEGFEFNLKVLTNESLKEVVLKEFDHQVDEEIIPWILNTHKTSIVEPVGESFKSQEIRSLIISPISTQTKVIGILMAFKKNWEKDIPQNSIEFINMALKVTALSIENAEINSEVKGKNKELQAYKDYSENINKSLSDTFVITDENFHIRDINKAGLHFFGYSLDEVKGQPLKMLFPEEKETELLRLFNRLLKEKVIKNYDFECINKYREKIPVSFACSIITGKEEKTLGLVVVVKDMADVRGLIEGLQKARDDLEKQKDQLEVQVKERTKDLGERLREIQYLSQYMKNILQSITSGVIAVDNDLKVTTFNHAAERMTGVDDFEIVGKNIADFPNFENICRMVTKTVKNNETLLGKEVNIKNSHNREVPINVTTSILSTELGETCGAIAVFSDLSIIKEIHKKLIQSERMAALGEMSYGVAHELRNPLNVVRGLCEIVMEEPPTPEKLTDFMEKIVSQIDRLELLVHQITEYVSQSEPVFDRNLVLPFFQNSVEAFKKNYLTKESKNIEICIEGQKVFPKCDFDRKQIRQVLYNILKNSLDAVDESGAVKIFLESDDKFLTVAVSDSGKGMERAVKERAFEAFFTTHRPKRTGLGLCVCKGIIERHSGSIHLESEIDKGTKVIFKIPISQEGLYDEKKDSFN